MRSALAVLFLVGLQAATAQDLPVQGPVLGYAWDVASSRLRPILGIPGSSLLGTPLDLGTSLKLAEVSPRQNYALAISADSGARVVHLTGGFSIQPIPGVDPEADRIALSPIGSAAAIYSQGRQTLQVVTRLPDAPSAASVALPGLLTALAVDDSGDLVLAVSGEQLFALGPRKEPRPLGPAGAAAAIAFAENSREALVADPARKEVFLLRGDNERLILAGERDGVQDPVAAALAGRRGFVADRSLNTILLVDLAGGPAAVISCPCEVTGLQRLRGDALFRLTASLQSASYLLEAGAAEPRLWFVPADAPVHARPPRERSR